MEIIQNRKTMKIISVLILMIMLISTITPVFAATKTANTLELRDTSVTVKAGRKGKIRIKTNTTGKDVTWTSSDKNKKVIGTLYGYPSGYVEFEALSVGTATVTATAGGKKATCKVEVTEGSSLNLGDLFKGGEDDKKTPELPSGGGTGEALSTLISTTFTGVTKLITSDEAKNAASGLGDIIMNFINSLLEGLRSIISNIKQIELPKGTDLPAEATEGETGKKDNKTVAVTSVSISGANKVKVGETITLTATVKPSNATNKKVTWSSDSKAATVGKESGIVEGVTAGETVTITATTSNKITATYEVSVETADSAPGGGGSNGESGRKAAGNEYGLYGTIYNHSFATEKKTPQQLGLNYITVSGVSTTNYCACRVCNQSTAQTTASGIALEPNRKIVAAWSKGSFVEYGDWIYMPGWGYALVADCGGFSPEGDHTMKLDCFVGRTGDIIDDGKGNYNANERRCINWNYGEDGGTWSRAPGNKTGLTIYVIKAKDANAFINATY